VSPLGYQRYLESLGLLHSALQADFLLVTTEDASLKPTGGIGTYVANIKRFNDRCVTLFCDLDPSVEAKDGRTILVRSVIEHLSWEQMIDGPGLIEAIKVVLFTLPNLRICEFQDYLSLGFRIVQAKKTGFFHKVCGCECSCMVQWITSNSESRMKKPQIIQLMN
jgi:hypothetical protein